MDSAARNAQIDLSSFVSLILYILSNELSSYLFVHFVVLNKIFSAVPARYRPPEADLGEAGGSAISAVNFFEVPSEPWPLIPGLQPLPPASCLLKSAPWLTPDTACRSRIL